MILCVANFITALAGGSILALGLNLSEMGKWGDSIFAYLLGATLSMAVLGMGYHWIEKRLHFISALSSILSVAIWIVSSLGEPVLLFSLVVLCFVTVFVVRSLRASIASGGHQWVSRVELSYAIGCGVGLIAGPKLGLPFGTAAGISAGLFALNSFLDFTEQQKILTGTEKEVAAITQSDGSETISVDIRMLIQSAFLLVLYTVIVQVGSQFISKITNVTYPLIFFDLGTLLAPLLIFYFGLELKGDDMPWLGNVVGNTKLKGFFVPVWFCFLISCFFMTLAFAWMFKFPYVVWALVGVASILYEMIALSLFDAMGKQPAGKKWVSYSFGMMGVGATATYIIFLISR